MKFVYFKYPHYITVIHPEERFILNNMYFYKVNAADFKIDEDFISEEEFFKNKELSLKLAIL